MFLGNDLRILYIDEAGCPGQLPHATSQVQPVFAIVGIVFDADNLRGITNDFLHLKRRFFPGLHASPHFLDGILPEIKGAEIRRDAAANSRRRRRAAFGFLDALFSSVEHHSGSVFGRVWIKGIGATFNGRSVYTSSMQAICSTYQNFLAQQDDRGIIIADSRNKPMNANVSHSVFTKKFRANGNDFDRLLEMPAFGHSENHAGIQIADLICSAIVFPLAVETYCRGHVTNVHTRNYGPLKSRYRQRLQSMQYRYQDSTGRWRGGLTVSDAISQQSGGLLFR